MRKLQSRLRVKHLPGQHPQKRHGWRRGGGGYSPATKLSDEKLATIRDQQGGSFSDAASVFDAIAESQGYTGRPQVVSKSELDEHIAKGDREAFRGFQNTDQAKTEAFADQLRTGDYFVGDGVSGPGIYAGTAADAKPMARAYAKTFGSNSNSGTVVRMAIRRQARTISKADLDARRQNADGVWAELARLGATPYAAALGYDVLDAGSGISVILNRTALRIQESNVS